MFSQFSLVRFLGAMKRGNGRRPGTRGQKRPRQPGLVLEALESRFMLSTTYYVAPAGRDTNNGTAPGSAWQSIDRVNQQVLGPGDSVLFQSGAVFHGSLVLGAPTSAGTAANPIHISSYGPNRATINAGVNTGIQISDAGGFDISQLNIVGSGQTVDPYLRNVSGDGIYVANNNQPNEGLLYYIHIDQVAIHGFGYYGIDFEAPAPANVLAPDNKGFQDVRITNVDLHDDVYGGILSNAQYAASLAFHDVYIGHVQVHNCTGVDGVSNSGNGIALGNTSGGTIERSVAHDNGGLGPNGTPNTGIWTFDSTNITIQYNEAYHMFDLSRLDGDGFDLDLGVTNSVLQYNYSHDNDGLGYFLIGVTDQLNTNNTIRFNISENDAHRSFGSLGVFGLVSNAEFYNNTVYSTQSTINPDQAAVLVSGAYWTGSHLHFRDNIFQTAGGVPTINTQGAVGGTDLLFQGNDYYSSGATFSIAYNGTNYPSLAAWQTATGQEKLNATSVGLSVDPQLTNPGHGGTIQNIDRMAPNLTAYTLKASSLLEDAALDLTALFGINMGRTDFYGHQLPAGQKHSMGADNILS